ncbi:MAG: tryptophan synthase subunit alpha [Bacteroidetes bacterium SB0662_bin_6]|nr:tryptophan synthase subunit alpha [Bacteroidetes bacterium SB0668_bin_1]MYE03429.1 tryptophan synthase subunit alpha [Bacteroidetes bacterium SB0662_bin_6]
MQRLQERLAACVQRREKAMGLFMTSGFPDPESTLPILRAMDQGGADFIELGMPFSDPLAEGLPIQRSSERALKGGVRMKDTFRTATAFCAESNTPLLLMGYANPIRQYGISAFCRDARTAGIEGLILADVPLEEHLPFAGEAAAAGLAAVLLIAPNTPDDRIREIDNAATGFVYAVSITGLTGSGLGAIEHVEAYLKRARDMVRENPLLAGFGIRTHEDAVRLSRHTDGFIVGSALIEKVETLWDAGSKPTKTHYEEICRFVRTLKDGNQAVQEKNT